MSDLESYFRNYFLLSLKQLANNDTQKQAWGRGDYKNFTDFNGLNDDFLTSAEYVLTWPIFSETQKEQLRSLYEMVDDYDITTEEVDSKGWRKRKTDKQIYNDPEWHKIREYAQKVYEDLKKIPPIKE